MRNELEQQRNLDEATTLAEAIPKRDCSVSGTYSIQTRWEGSQGNQCLGLLIEGVEGMHLGFTLQHPLQGCIAKGPCCFLNPGDIFLWLMLLSYSIFRIIWSGFKNASTKFLLSD